MQTLQSQFRLPMMHVLQHICSSRVTLKYETLTLTLTLMFEHISTLHPRIELHTCGCAHVPSMRSVNANHARAGSVCTPFAARLQLTRNPKIRNPNPNPIEPKRDGDELISEDKGRVQNTSKWGWRMYEAMSKW